MNGKFRSGQHEELQRIEVAALERFMLDRTVPIVSTQSNDGSAVLLGTSTLLEVAGVLFLVTAAHLFEYIVDLAEIAVPDSPMTGKLWTLGNSILHRADGNIDLDLALFEIRSAETEARLRQGWKVLTPSMIDAPGRSGRNALCGYPEDYTSRTEDFLFGKLLTVYTAQLVGIPTAAELPVDPDLDLFFLCDDSAEDLFGGPAKLPSLRGTSGSSIWEIREPGPNEPWTIERVIRVIGVNRTSRPNQYFRARPWWLVAEMLSKHDNFAVAAEGALLKGRIAPPW